MRARYPFLIRSYTIYIRQDKTPDGSAHIFSWYGCI
nr:MAG TPA: hypothetical protein [Caudoviricetes sp.]